MSGAMHMRLYNLFPDAFMVKLIWYDIWYMIPAAAAAVAHVLDVLLIWWERDVYGSYVM